MESFSAHCQITYHSTIILANSSVTRKHEYTHIHDGPHGLLGNCSLATRTSSNHHPFPIKHPILTPVITPIESCPDIRKFMHVRWISPWAPKPKIIQPSSFPIRVSKLPSHHHPSQNRPREEHAFRFFCSESIRIISSAGMIILNSGKSS